MAYKLLRGDFYCWYRLEGAIAILCSFFERVCVKIIMDYTGCLHLRHPYELGGLAFSISMIWAQAFPFVALQLYEDSATTKDALTLFLVDSFTLWLLLNIAFFCTIDLRYLGTFFGTKTAPQYTCDYFLTSTEDFQKWDAVFENRLIYITSIHKEVKTWVADSVARWKYFRPPFFKVEMIPDDLRPAEVLVAEGGATRRRSNASSRDLVGFKEDGSNKVHPVKVEDGV